MAGVNVTAGQASVLAAIAVSASLVMSPAAAQAFADEFDGDKLAEAWTVENPDQDSYSVDNGSLLVLANTVAEDVTITDGSPANLFTIDTRLPDGNWTMSVRFSADLKTARESLVFGLLDGADRYVLADIHTAGDSNRGWQLNAGIGKRSGKAQAAFTEPVALMRCNICGKTRTFEKFAATIAMPIDAQIVKSGREYTLNVRTGGDGGTWKTMATVISINPPVRPVLFVRQMAEADGESVFRIDRFRIDAAR